METSIATTFLVLEYRGIKFSMIFDLPKCAYFVSTQGILYIIILSKKLLVIIHTYIIYWGF
jgi:hypothetical protein